MVLGVSSKLALDTIDKDLEVHEIFSKEVLKLRSQDQSCAVVTALILGLSEADGTAEEYGGKRGAIHPCGV